MDAQVTRARPVTIAIVALGGEGGGVLADWIVDLAELGGYLAQATSVPGVAQRTGATIYYVELFPKTAAQTAGREPVLGLLPMPGDVDVVLASELMEAARAVERGFVTPERTLLITSTHRVFSMTERIALADGRVDAAALFSACRQAAREVVAFDMAALAEATGSVLSAVLFGALAGAGALPMARSAFEAAIRRGQVGVKQSLAAFAAGFETACAGDAATPAADAGGPAATEVPLPLRELLRQAARDYSGEAGSIVRAGLERLNDYQDADYAREFLARLAQFRALEQRHGDGSSRLLCEVARQLALGMAYEDTIRVAELKTRPGRFARVREEAQVAPDQILEIAEFFHPRVQEIADTLPAPAGRWLLRTGWARRIAERLLRSGKIVKTTSVSGFLLLYVLARLKPLRRRSLRFAGEQIALAEWLDLVAETAAVDYALALEIARARGLIKGYGETLERGRAKFAKLTAALPHLRTLDNAGPRFADLIRAAQADEEGSALDRAIDELLDQKRAFRAPSAITQPPSSTSHHANPAPP
jgi:indolepyruvate ferredoxin oxidoreductase beta subunit